ncbi:hypothetical protein [Shimia sediminis]|uniref:hypothetical protein n=1 Tax=Shimia sediminis TaxID=2497945 RepID=UPI000F8D4066|nr:hypothetical protein [Shimia sediminis]
MAATSPHRPASETEAPATFGRRYNMSRERHSRPPAKSGLNKAALFLVLVIALAGLLSLTAWLTP